jgi:5-methylcytosine-specific restriction endonuclease McrA
VKTCRLCEQEKPLSEFYVRAESGKVRSECKTCCIANATKRSPERREYRKQYYQRHSERAKELARNNYAANRERRLQVGKAWYQRNIDAQRKAGSERARAWALANPERHRAKSRETARRRRLTSPTAVAAEKQRDYKKHRAERLATSKAWRQRNPERVYAQALQAKHRRRSRLENVRVESVERLKVFERDEWTCRLCNLPVTKADASIDHIIPVARGGEHTYENCQTAHLKCNISKGARTETVA